MLHVKVPATSANLGPGFDSLGIALNLYNEFLVQDKNNAPVPDGYTALYGNHLAALAAAYLARETGRTLPDIQFAIKAQVPRSRGLGSSATLTVGGLKAADKLLGTGLTNEELLAMASNLEGHPDNAAPALMGGFVISIKEKGKIQYLRTMPSRPLLVVAGVPDFDVKTINSRKALPKTVPFSDAVFNVGRASLLVGALLTGRYEHLRTGTADCLHQPYRKALVPGLDEVMSNALAAGAYGVCLSGSGPTVLAFCSQQTAQVEKEILRTWKAKGINGRTYRLRLCDSGATVTCK